MRFQNRRLSIFVALAFFSAMQRMVDLQTHDKTMADVTIAVDLGPLYLRGKENDWTMTQANNRDRLEFIISIIKSMLSMGSVNVRIAVLVAHDGEPLPLVSFTEGVNADTIKAKIEQDLMGLRNKRYDHHDLGNNLKKIVYNLRKDYIEKSDGNRPEALDILLWVLVQDTDHAIAYMEPIKNFEKVGVGIDTFYILLRAREPDDPRNKIYALTCLTGVMCAIVEYFFRPPMTWLFRDHTFYLYDNNSQRVEQEYPIKKRIEEILGLPCPQYSSVDGPCYFNAKQSCVMTRSFELPLDYPGHLAKYCEKQTEEMACGKGSSECQEQCDKETDHEEKPCNASCGDGMQLYRPKKAQSDPLFTHCPWKLKPCRGPPCPPGTTITTTTTTTSGSSASGTTGTTKTTTTSTTTTTRRSRTTTRKHPTPAPGPQSPNLVVTTTESTVSVEQISSTKAATTPGSGLETWKIVLIAIGSLALVALIIVAVACVVRKRKQRPSGSAPWLPPIWSTQSRLSNALG